MLDESVDFLFLQAVMEYVTNVSGIYRNCPTMLRVGGIISHSIDFKSGGKSMAWNGHWRYLDWLWKIIVSRRPFPINREPLSSHLKAEQYNEFEALDFIPVLTKNTLSHKRLAVEFKQITEDEPSTSGAFIIARKL